MRVSTKCHVCLMPLDADSVHGFCAECVANNAQVERLFTAASTYTQSQLDAAVAEAKRACAAICEAAYQDHRQVFLAVAVNTLRESQEFGAAGAAAACRDAILATITEPTT